MGPEELPLANIYHTDLAVYSNTPWSSLNAGRNSYIG